MSLSEIAASSVDRLRSTPSNGTRLSAQVAGHIDDASQDGGFFSLLAWRSSSRPTIASLPSTQNGSGFLAVTPSLPARSSSFSAKGLTLSLFDPNAAFEMMSLINDAEVSYKTQFAELSKMSGAVAAMRGAGETLAGITPATDNETIGLAFQTFADRYNAWIERFGDSVKTGGVLAGTQAAEVSLRELEQSVDDVFNGAGSGFHGVRDIGLRIEPKSGLAIFDPEKLQTMLASNRENVIATIAEFGSNFARSAELLNSANNFIPNRLVNLDRVIDYLDENLPALCAEFGSAAPANRSTRTAEALAAYERIISV